MKTLHVKKTAHIRDARCFANLTVFKKCAMMIWDFPGEMVMIRIANEKELRRI